jgi:hypothetical protein
MQSISPETMNFWADVRKSATVASKKGQWGDSYRFRAASLKHKSIKNSPPIRLSEDKSIMPTTQIDPGVFSNSNTDNNEDDIIFWEEMRQMCLLIAATA